MVLPNDGTGGMQSQARLLAQSVHELGHDVVIGVGGGVVGDASVPQRSLPRFSPITAPWLYLRLLWLVVSQRATVVHAHGLRLGPLVAFLPVRRRIVTCHGVDPEHVSTRLMWLLAHSPVTVVSCGLAPHRELARHHVASDVINNALGIEQPRRTRSEFDAHFGTSPDDFVALWPARYSRQKGHDLLVETFRDLQGTNIKVVCCGDGPLREETAAAIAASGLSDNLLVRDFEPSAASWLAATDFFYVPSRWEGQPLVVLEAVRAGVPVISLIPLEHVIAPVPTVHHAAALIRQWAQGDDRYVSVKAAMANFPLHDHDSSIIARQYVALYDSRGR